MQLIVHLQISDPNLRKKTKQEIRISQKKRSSRDNDVKECFFSFKKKHFDNFENNIPQRFSVFELVKESSLKSLFHLRFVETILK